MSRLTDPIQVALDALDKLARLGNEPFLGNSNGNVIARDAADKIRSLLQAHTKVESSQEEIRANIATQLELVIIAREAVKNALIALEGGIHINAILALEQALK